MLEGLHQVTHVYKYIAQITVFIIGMAISFTVNECLNLQLGHWPLCFLYFGCVIVVCPVYPLLLRPLADWLYCAIHLRTILTWSETHKVQWLFKFDIDMEWTPMTGLRDFPPEQRKTILLEAAEYVRTNRSYGGLFRYM